MDASPSLALTGAVPAPSDGAGGGFPFAPGTVPPEGGDASISTGLMVVMWVFWSLTTVILASRLVAAVTFVNRLRLSEYLMVFSYLCATIQNVIFTLAIQAGLGRHLFYLMPDRMATALYLNYLSQAWSIAASSLARISCCVFLLGFVSQYQRHRIPLWVFMILQVLLSVVIVILIYAWQQSWNVAILTAFTYLQCSFNTLLDFYLTVTPFFMFWPLQMPMLQRAGLAILFSCSVFAFAASIVKISLIYRLQSFNDYTWEIIPFSIWAVLEAYVIIICGSVPMMKPLVRWLRLGTWKQSSACSGDSSTPKHQSDSKANEPNNHIDELELEVTGVDPSSQVEILRVESRDKARPDTRDSV